MSNHEQPTPSHPRSDVRNTIGKDKQTPQGSARTTSAVDLEEFCEKHYEKLLPIMADKYEYEKRKKEKLEEVKARLDFGDARKKSTRAQESAYSESRTISPRRQRRSRSPRHNPSVFTRLRRERSRSPRHEYKSKERRESTVFKRLGSRGRSTSAHSDSRQESSRYTENYSESEDSEGGHWKSKSRRKKFSVEDDDLSQPWVCAETDPFTSRIRHFDFPKTRMPSHVKTYNGSEDPEDHLKIFQAAAKTERWAMPTWCHMFNSTLTGNARVWFDDLPPESIDSYNDLREAFLKNYLQQKKCIRDPIVLHNIKQRDGESTEDFIQRYKSESGNVKGAPECMRISGFVHGITNPELIKRFHEKIPKTVDEMMQVATSFLQGQEAASNQERKKVPQAWRHPEGNHRQNFKKGGGFRSQHKTEKRPDRFTLLTKTPKEILALEKGKFKTPPPMTTPVEKRNANKFCEFHGEVGHNTDECNHLRKQIEDMLKAGKLSHIIRELKQNSGKEQPKKKGETSGKEKPQAILMIQSRQNAVRQKITQSFSPDLEISFPSLGNDEGAEGPLIIEAEVGGHQVHRMCIDGGSSFEILYEHCFNRLRPEIRNQMVPATTSLVGFSGEIKWPLGQITLLVKVGDDEHSTSAWMDFMVVRSTSPFNGIIGRPGLRKMKAVPSTTHGMIKFPVMGGTLTLRSSKIIPIECAMISGPEDQPPTVNKVKEERIKVAINPEHPEQTVMIGSNLTEKTRNSAPEEQKELIVYLAASKEAVSAVLMTEREARQMSIYFVSRELKGPEINYTAMEKLVLALVHASKRLRRYFQAHPITVITDQPIKNILSNPEVAGRMQKWSIQLGEFGIHYRPRVSVKGQVLADFIVERPEDEGQDNSAKEEEPLPARWTLFTDGSSCVDGCGAGVILTDPEGVEFTYALRFQFEATNNEAEYEALIAGLRIAEKIGVQNLEVNVDSKLVANQVLSKVSGEITTIFQNFEKMHKKSDFLWTEEAEAAFKQMKEHIAKLPMLTAPEEQEELIVYLAASKEAVSAVLMTEREARQMPIYFVSRALRGPEINYTAMEKLVLALVHASKRLRRYFQAHPITFGIHYRPRVSVKGQVLADFIVERPEEEGQDDSAREKKSQPGMVYHVHDGSSALTDQSRIGTHGSEGMESFTYAEISV
ncbi:reverse transcriptase domain-containing protein [Tanacetum coccineum]